MINLKVIGYLICVNPKFLRGDCMKLGAHLSISKGFLTAVETALDIGGNTFQFFTRNPRGGKAKRLDLEDIKKADEACRKNNFASLLAHAPYTYNFASNSEQTWEFSKERLKDDFERLQHLNSCEYIVMHPGSHVGEGIEFGIERIAKGINQVLRGKENTMLLLETMSGKGSEIGFSFEQLKEIIARVEHSHLIGVCFDTCHVYSAGYDILGNLDGVLKEFDNVIGLERLKAIHLNDSINDYGTKKDRHAKIGEGVLGLDGILNFINHPKLKNLPFLLETPNEIEGYAEEIKVLKYGYNSC